MFIYLLKCTEAECNQLIHDYNTNQYESEIFNVHTVTDTKNICIANNSGICLYVIKKLETNTLYISTASNAGAGGPPPVDPFDDLEKFIDIHVYTRFFF